MNFVNEQLSNLNMSLGGSIQNLSGDRVVQFTNDYGIGSIYGTELGSGMTYMEYKLQAKERLTFDFSNMGKRELFFIYCSEGELHFSVDGESDRIQALQTAILGGDSILLSIQIASGVKADFAVIHIPELVLETQSESERLLNHQVFNRFLKDRTTINYIGTFNLKIREQLKQISTIRETGAIRHLLIKGIIHFTLALEILQYVSDEKNSLRGSTKLVQRELKLIEEASEEIRNTPEYPFSIEYLSRKYALSPSKLQEGFKVIHGSTVTNFIKGVRIEMAERLIRNSDMNISEVVYSVGFTSRSYFSKIFKERFKCSPKYYQDHCKLSTTET